MNLSIIIVNFNTKELIKNCINSIKANADNLSYEIIVVDNDSKDDSCSFLRTIFPDVILISNKENVGFAKANNQGIRISKGQYILLLNSDTIIINDCLQKTLLFADSILDAGVIGCKVLNSDRSLQYTCYHHPNLITEVIFFTKNILKGFFDPISYWKSMKYWNHKNIKKVDSISGCFFWLRRELIEEVGMLDENIFMYYEDAEFCRRVQKNKKFSIVYFPNAEIIHYHGGSSKDETKTAIMKTCFNAALYYFEKTLGKSYMKLFYFICKFVWYFELLVLNCFKKNNLAIKKISLLKELLNK